MERQSRLCNSAVMREATRRLSQLYDEFLRPSGLRTTQYAIMVRIHRVPGSTMRTLARRLVMDQSAFGHALKPLVREGYVTLATDKGDRRVKTVSLTSSGEAKFAEAAILWRQAQAAFERAYGSERAAQLRETTAYLASDDFLEAFRKAAAA